MTHVHREQSDTVNVDPKGHITVKTWAPETLREHIKRWPILDTDTDRLRAIHQLDDSLAESITETENIAVDGLLTFIAQGLDPTSLERAETSHLALGTDTTEPQASNESLGNEVYRTIVGDAEVDGADLLTSTFLSQTEANGYLLTELGLVGGPDQDDPLLTHALFASGEEIDKSTDLVATIDYVLELRRPA